MNHSFHMIDVGGKRATHRVAIAEGCIVVGEQAFVMAEALVWGAPPAVFLSRVEAF